MEDFGQAMKDSVKLRLETKIANRFFRRCRVCGSEWPASAKYCRECGVWLGSTGKTEELRWYLPITGVAARSKRHLADGVYESCCQGVFPTNLRAKPPSLRSGFLFALSGHDHIISGGLRARVIRLQLLWRRARGSLGEIPGLAGLCLHRTKGADKTVFKGIGKIAGPDLRAVPGGKLASTSDDPIRRSSLTPLRRQFEKKLGQGADLARDGLFGARVLFEPRKTRGHFFGKHGTYPCRFCDEPGSLCWPPCGIGQQRRVAIRRVPARPTIAA